ncbi:MAG: hypothetical protein R3B09_11005 [Nannocystaceae bacterium]
MIACAGPRGASPPIHAGAAPAIDPAIAPTPATPPETAAAAPTRRAAPLPSARAIGSAHPIAVQASSADGRWIVACQARADTNGDGAIGVAIGPHGDFYGDLMRPYLIVGDGEGEVLDAYLASDRSERRLVTLEAGALTLRDLDRGVRRVLDTGGLPRDPRGAGGEFIAGLDGDRRLVYLRGADPTARRLVVHDLDDGAETEVDPGPGKLLRAFVPVDGGRIVVFADLPRGDRYMGRYSYTTRHRGPCRGPIMSSSTYAGGGPPSETRVIDLDRGDRWILPSADGRLVGLLGDAAIVRQADGSLWIEALRGPAPPRPLVDDACHGIVLGASAARESLLVRCRSDDHKSASLRIYGPRGVRHLADAHAYADTDAWWGGDHPRALAWRTHDDRLAVDLESGRADPLALLPGGRHLAEDEHHVLQRVNDHLVLTATAGGAHRPLPAAADEYPRRHQRGSIVAIDHILIDLAAGELLGALPTPPEALTDQGHALTPDPDPDHRVLARNTVPLGPLRWRTATPCEGTCPIRPAY